MDELVRRVRALLMDRRPGPWSALRAMDDDPVLLCGGGTCHGHPEATH